MWCGGRIAASLLLDEQIASGKPLDTRDIPIVCSGNASSGCVPREEYMKYLRMLVSDDNFAMLNAMFKQHIVDYCLLINISSI